MTDKLANTTAERDLLGSILTDSSDFYKVSPILRAGDFYRQDYQQIYAIMTDMILQGQRPDIATLIEAAKGEKGDTSLVKSIFDLGSVGKSYNLEEKAAIIADNARRRRLMEKSRELAELAKDYGEDVDKITATFCNDLQGIGLKVDKATGDMETAITDLLATLDRRYKGEAMDTGLIDLDRIITGFEPGQLVIIAGRPGHGKSALAGTIAVNLAKRGRRVLLFSMEMSKGEVAGRFVSRLAHIPGGVLKRPGDMTDTQKEAMINGFEALKALPITINTQGSLTPEEVTSIATRQERTEGLDLVIVDYLQLMSTGKKVDGSRVQEISYITRTLKNLAVSLDVPILLLSQLSRANDKENRPPRLTDLRDSGTIEQDANTVILLNREIEGGQMTAKTIANVAKQRDNSPGTCTLYFACSYGHFGNYDHSRDVPL